MVVPNRSRAKKLIPRVSVDDSIAQAKAELKADKEFVERFSRKSIARALGRFSRLAMRRGWLENSDGNYIKEGIELDSVAGFDVDPSVRAALDAYEAMELVHGFLFNDGWMRNKRIVRGMRIAWEAGVLRMEQMHYEGNFKSGRPKLQSDDLIDRAKKIKLADRSLKMKEIFEKLGGADQTRMLESTFRSILSRAGYKTWR